jgi:hypothetical protein
VFADLAAVSQKEQIRRKVGLQRDPRKTPPQLDGRHGSFLRAVVLRTGMETEERQVVTAGEGVQLSTSEGNSVDLVESISEQSHAKRLGFH